MKIIAKTLSIVTVTTVILLIIPMVAHATTYKSLDVDDYGFYNFGIGSSYEVTICKDDEKTFWIEKDGAKIDSVTSSDTSILKVSETDEFYFDATGKKKGTAIITITGFLDDDNDIWTTEILITVGGESLEKYDNDDVFKGHKNLESYVEFDVDKPVYATWDIEVEAKRKTSDRLTFVLQKKEKNGYKNYYSFNFSIQKSDGTWNYWYNDKASDKLKTGHYRVKIVPKKNAKSFYKAKCYVNLYESIKAISPSKLKKKYTLWPGETVTIAKSEGTSQLYIKGIKASKGYRYAWIDYNQVDNEWYVEADNSITSTANEKLTVTFNRGKKKTTSVKVQPLRWNSYWLCEGDSFKEYYYRYDGKKWGKWKLKNIKWSSTNKKIASVSKTGKVKGKRLGTCYIVGKYKNKAVKCKVTVYARKPRKGMTKKQVINSKWGSPTSRNNYGHGYVQWVYEWDDGETAYVYFKKGRVTNVQRFNY